MKSRDDHAEAYQYALTLAQAMHRDWFAKDAPNWKPFDDLLGLLTQIDNMVVGLTRAPAPYAPLTRDEVRDLTSLVWGAPASDAWVDGAGLPMVRQYELCRAAGMRPKDPCRDPQIAPWPDFAGNELRVGIAIVHPADGAEAIVAYDDSQEGALKWRAVYLDGTSSALCLQVGEKGRAVVKDVVS